MYWNILKNLDADTKLDLISKLSASLLKREKPTTAALATKYYGAWEDDKPAEELAAEIRASRLTGTRETATFD